MGDWTSVQRLTPAPNPGNQRGQSFYRQEEGPRAETAQSALTVIFKLVISGLTHVILIALCTLVFSSRTHVFAFLEAIIQKCGSLCHGYILAIMWLTSPPGVLGSIWQLSGYGSEYYL